MIGALYVISTILAWLLIGVAVSWLYAYIVVEDPSMNGSEPGWYAAVVLFWPITLAAALVVGTIHALSRTQSPFSKAHAQAHMTVVFFILGFVAYLVIGFVVCVGVSRVTPEGHEFDGKWSGEDLFFYVLLWPLLTLLLVNYGVGAVQTPRLLAVVWYGIRRVAGFPMRLFHTLTGYQ